MRDTVGVRVDHVIYAVRDLDAAAARLKADFGLDSVDGGRHPGWGTANRIVPLGAEYLELMTVADPDEAAASPVGSAVLEVLKTREGLMGWAVATDDIASVAGRLGLEIGQGSRARPDGVTLSWELAGVGDALRTGALPFFIQWHGPPEMHPARAPAAHDCAPSGIAWVEVRGDVDAWLGDHDLPLRASDGPPAIAAAAIGTAEGEIVLR